MSFAVALCDKSSFSHIRASANRIFVSLIVVGIKLLNLLNASSRDIFT